MAISPAEMLGPLKEIQAKAEAAAVPTVMAMADTYRDHVKKVTLRRSFAAVGQYGTPAPDTGPPAWRSGDLARSVTSRLSGAGAATASAAVSPHTIYAATQETGGVHERRRARYMHWVNSGGSWYLKRVEIPKRPYMAPAARECVENGSLTKAAAEMFMAVVWG